MAKCKYCGEDVPLEQLLPHINAKHREESRSKSKNKAIATENKLKAVGEHPPSKGNIPEKPAVAAATEPAPPSETKPETPPTPEIKPAPSEEPQNLSEAEPETAGRGKTEITTVNTAGVFTYDITLPADAFTLFNLAKACGLEPNDKKLFDEWIWDCVRARFSKDYKKQLILAPVEV